MRFKTKWERGDKRILAERANISPQYLSNIIAGRKQCNADKAMRLEEAARSLGYRITRAQWAFPDCRNDNPLFKR